MTKQRLISLLVTTMLIVATLFVSCTPQSGIKDTDTVSVYFGDLVAKGIDNNVYSVTPSGEITESKVDGLSVEKLYWSYKAVKADDNFKDGETGSMTGNVDGYMPVTSGMGLNATITGLAKGKWNFYLQAFTTAEDRTAGTPVIYSGESGELELLQDGTVTIATNYVYNKDGKGKVNFEIAVNIEQTLPEDTETTIKYYEVTAVKAYAGDLSVDLTGAKTSGDNAKYAGTWTGSIEDVPYSLATTKYEVYVDGETIPRATISGNSVVMTNLETNVKGTATLTLTTGTVSVTFEGSSVPEAQPVILEAVENVGDTITLGKSGETDIVWKALAVDTDNKRALLLSQDVLETMKFDADFKTGFPEYEGSDIQTYLRSDKFYEKYSLSKDYMLKVVITTDIKTTTISETGEDYVFLLSETEALTTDEAKDYGKDVTAVYFSDDNARIAYLAGTATRWWLRSDAGAVIKALLIDQRGGGRVCECRMEGGLRPAFWYSWN